MITNARNSIRTSVNIMLCLKACEIEMFQLIKWRERIKYDVDATGTECMNNNKGTLLWY